MPTVSKSRGQTITTGTVSVTDAATLVLAASHSRRSVALSNLGATNPATVGDSNVAYATRGVRVNPDATLILDEAPNAAIYAICNTGLTTTIGYLVESD